MQWLYIEIVNDRLKWHNIWSMKGSDLFEQDYTTKRSICFSKTSKFIDQLGRKVEID